MKSILINVKEQPINIKKVVYIGLCGEIDKLDLNLPYYKKNLNIEPTGCCVISENRQEIIEHQKFHGGCDTIILEGILENKNGEISLYVKTKVTNFKITLE